jgi:hypothetical protein
MNRLTCITCQQPIPNGQAVTRSVRFVQRHWHVACWAATHVTPLAGRVPAQRVPSDERVSA